MKHAVLLLAVGVSLLAASPAAAATLYMAPGGSGTACTTLAPCGSMEAAYRAASLGDTVELKGGSYGGQTIQASASKGQPDAVLPKVTFRPALGAAVTFTGGITLYVPHVAIEDVAVRGTLWARYRPENPALENSGDVHFRRLNLTGGRVMFNAVKNFSLIDSEITGLPRDGIDIYGSPSGTAGTGHYPSNGLIEGNWIHDLPLIDGDHIDGIQFTAGQDIVIRNNTIGPRVHHQDMLLKTDLGPVYNVAVQGNTFHPVVQPGFSFMAVKVNGFQCDSLSISGNDFVMNPTPRDAATQCSGTMTGNTFRQSMSSFHCDLWKATFSMLTNTFLSGEPCGTVGTNPTPTPTPTPTPIPTPTPTPSPSPNGVNAEWSHTPASPLAGEPVTFDGTASTPGSATCSWDFSAVQQRTGCLIDFTFQAAGEKRVTLTVTKPNGAWDLETKTIVVGGTPGSTTAAYGYSPQNPSVGETVRFDASPSTCSSSCTYTWTDDGPDGPGGINWSLGAGAVLERSFGSAGIKYVRLTVTGGDGDTATTMKQVVVGG
jgi:hypothetical protein